MSNTRPARNPWVIAAGILAGTLLLVGFIVWTAGLAAAGSTLSLDPSSLGGPLVAQAVGTTLMSLGAVGGFVWLAAAAIAWELRRRG